MGYGEEERTPKSLSSSPVGRFVAAVFQVVQLARLPWEPCATYLVLRRENLAVVANSGRLLKMCVVLEMHLDLFGSPIGCHDFPGQASSL